MGSVTGLVEMLLAQRQVLPVAADVALAGEGLARPFVDPRPAPELPGFAGERFSGVARLIGSVLEAAGEPMADAAEPLAPNARQVDAAVLAPRLRQALADSGLFYESHLAALGAGQLDRADLAAEPQGRWPHGPARDATAAAPQDAVAPPLRGLVARQLEALATGVVTWRGEAWPGATMEWRVQEDGREREEPAADGARSWSTTVTIAAPRLGPVQVRLSLAGVALHVTVHAAPMALAPLREAATPLREALVAAGFDAPPMAVHLAGASS